MTDSAYSSRERRIARILGRFPGLKPQIKRLYQRLNYARHKTGYTDRSVYPTHAVLGGDQECFFGYYDRSPESAAGQVLVHLPLVLTNGQPRADVPITVALLAKDGSEAFRLDTKAYNWQQGARALWAGTQQFLFNDFDEHTGTYVAHLVSAADGAVVRSFAHAVQDVYSNEYFVSLDYRRLLTLRPDYGYRNLPALTSDELGRTEADGVWRVDIQTGEAKLLYSLAQAISLRSGRDFSPGQHKFNHAIIGPSGENFIILHRRYVERRREDRLLSCRADGTAIRLLTDTGMVSHCTWIDDNRVLAYMRDPHGKDGYRIVNVDSGTISVFANGALDRYGDGHPHVHGDWVITDTYPNKASVQKLILANWRSGEVRELGEFLHPLEYFNESRCDLHPRFSPDGRRIYFDSVFSGLRMLYCMELPE